METTNRINDPAFQRRVKQIEDGQYTFAEVYNLSDKELMESIFLEKLEDGSITEPAKISLVRYECDEIIRGRKTLEDLPESISSIIKNNENYMNYIKKSTK